MKSFITHIVQSFGSFAIFAIPIITAQNFHWESLSIGTILNAVYLYLLKKQAVAGAAESETLTD